jgi:Undecaprenyl-phosphate glucose phosphotransferase
MAIKTEAVKSATPGIHASDAALSTRLVASVCAFMDAIQIIGSGLLIFLFYVAPDDPGKSSIYLVTIGLVALLSLQAFQLGGLYRFTSITAPINHVFRLGITVAVILMVMLVVGFALKISDQFSRIWLFSWFLSMLILLIGERFALAAMVRRFAETGRMGRNILIYGAGDHAEQLIKHLDDLNEPWNNIVGVFDDRNLQRVGHDIRGYPMLGGLEELLHWARKHRADDILVAIPWGAQDRILELLSQVSSLPANVRLSPEFVGTKLLHRQISHHYDVPMLTVLDKPLDGLAVLSKLIVDYGFGAVGFLLALPTMALIAIAIKLESPGPVLFRQKRYGFNNQLIDVLKFRTMYIDQQDADAEKLTERDDPRVTRVGAILRRFSLDELPQLINVLRGEMSVVGPRPHAIRAKAGGRLYEEVVDEYAVRHKVKPGITGWAQVNGWRGNTETEQDIRGRVEHDLYYIENWSLMLDLNIIVRTFFTVLGGRNSF